jgi:hypothetical protein
MSTGRNIFDGTDLMGKLDEVDSLCRRLPFGQVEEWIEDQPLGVEEKSALWLAAFAEQTPRTQRRLVHGSMVALRERARSHD